MTPPCLCRNKKTNPLCLHPFCVAYRRIEPLIISFSLQGKVNKRKK
jgi:hypothetical protein